MSYFVSVDKNRLLYYASTIQGKETQGKEFFDADIPILIFHVGI